MCYGLSLITPGFAGFIGGSPGLSKARDAARNGRKPGNRKKSMKSAFLGWTAPLDQPINRARCPTGQRFTGQAELLLSAGRYLKK